jgi:hypothetical protein
MKSNLATTKVAVAQLRTQNGFSENPGSLEIY